MKSRFGLIAVFLSATLGPAVGAESDGETSQLPPKERFHLFLLAGQSNMAGRGKIAPQDTEVHPRVFTLNRDDEWVPAQDPIHFDKAVAGVCLGRTFAMTLAEKDPQVVIGLIPCAAGGSPIDSWKPGGYHGQTKSHPYDEAIRRTRIAQQRGTLRGVLWHQGESDSKPELAGAYEQKLHALIKRFRKTLESPQLPFVVGQLGRFPERPWNEWKLQVHAAHASLPQKVQGTAFVSSADLTPKSDGVHFDAASLREFGKRYAQAYLHLVEESK